MACQKYIFFSYIYINIRDYSLGSSTSSSYVNINSSEIDHVFFRNLFRDFSHFLNVYSVMGPETNPKN